MLMACLLAGGRLFSQTDTTKNGMDSTLSFAVKAGVNMQSLSGKSWTNDFRPGVVAGVNVGWHKKKIGVAAEVLVSSASYESTLIQDSASKEYLKLNAIYISIPVLFQWQFIPALKLQVGPQYSNLMSMKGANFTVGDPKVLFKSSEFSAVVGLEATFAKKINVGARFIAGLSDVNNGGLSTAASEAWTNTAIQVHVGYKIK